jgi:tetratricopeptide (TPR) repeat protein
VNLAGLLAERGEAARAAAGYRAALALAPSMVAAAIGLAEVLAASPDPAVRNGREALAWARRAVRATDRRSARALAALAAAYAETGRFDAAVRWQERALALAPAERAADHAARLALYREGSPWRRPPAPRRGHARRRGPRRSAGRAARPGSGSVS